MNIFNPLDQFGASIKTSFDALKSLPFSRYGANGWGGGYGTSYGNLNDMRGSFLGAGLPGTNYDYRSAAGVLWQNPSAAACFLALTTAFAQARPILEKRNKRKSEQGEWQQVDDHPLVTLLNKPNPFYSGEKMFGVTLMTMLSYGTAFWRMEKQKGTGLPGEIWFEPPHGIGATGIAPNWDDKEFIKNYFYFVDGKRIETPIERANVVYYRAMLDPLNTRLGWAPLGVAAREIATLNGCSTYTGSLLRNSAVPSGALVLDGQGVGVNTPLPTPDQATAMKAQIKAGFTGDNMFDVFVSSLPWKWEKFGWSPREMRIDSIAQWPQGIVCALLRTPEIVAGLPTGEQPTYQNLMATKRTWWDDTIIPLEDSAADEVETQLFPAFDLDSSDWRMAWDRSRVPALQEDVTAKSKMIDEDYKAGVIDLWTAQTERGLADVPDNYKGMFYPSAVPAPLAPANGEGAPPDGAPLSSDDSQWTEDDDAKLSELWESADNETLLGAFPDKSEGEIASHAAAIGLKAMFEGWMEAGAIDVAGWNGNGYKADRGHLVGGHGASHQGGHYEGAEHLKPLSEREGQARAKVGGEYGPNGEWYPGGAFIATTDMPKMQRANSKRQRKARK